ncbi:MAG: YHS domain-containing protein [candidate division Zixibacteria bacterium]|nr:YHS domain-containing protein [candidate division Zixibacteria bacterium]
MTQFVDPVCYMSVTEESSAGHSNFENQTYYFCSADCKRQFDEDPQKYARKAIGNRVR